MKFALLLLFTSLNLSIAADATRAVTARALETAEEKKEWEGHLKKAVEKTIKWSGNAGALRSVKNMAASMSDMMVGTAKAAVGRSLKQKQRNQERDLTKHITDFFK